MADEVGFNAFFRGAGRRGYLQLGVAAALTVLAVARRYPSRYALRLGSNPKGCTRGDTTRRAIPLQVASARRPSPAPTPTQQPD